MMRLPQTIRIAMVIVSLGTHSVCLAGDEHCANGLEEAKQAAPSESFDRFDQTPKRGWRLLAEQQQCFEEAGELIDSYLSSRADLNATQRVSLSFHAGQVYAMAGRNDEALARFRRAVVNPSASPKFKWSEYVLATMAFLEHDGEAIVKYHDAIQDAGDLESNRLNLRVVERLMANFDKSYREALSSDSRK